MNNSRAQARKDMAILSCIDGDGTEIDCTEHDLDRLEKEGLITTHVEITLKGGTLRREDRVYLTESGRRVLRS